MRLAWAPTLWGIMDIYGLSTMETLNGAFYECERACRWKDSAQRYRANLLANNLRLQRDLRGGTYAPGATNDFTISERGKVRQIRAPAMRDRVVQKALMRKVLLPQVVPHLIYDNYASLKGRGTSFARKRLDIMLQRHVREHGSDGFVVLADVHDYFGSVDHATLKSQLRGMLDVPDDVMGLIGLTIDAPVPGPRGINLGSECPQIYAVEYLNPVDQYVKCVLGTPSYGRYMDDMVSIAADRAEADATMSAIRSQTAMLGLDLNGRKSHVTPLSDGFTFMQIRYSVDGTKVIKRPTRQKVARIRSRMRAHRRLVDDGRMTARAARECYMTSRGQLIAECNRVQRTLESLDALADELFPPEPPRRRPGRDEIIDRAFKEMRMG